jgi:ABC-type transport system substrate-binding protein
VVVTEVSDPQALILNLETRTLDGIYNFPIRQIERLQQLPNTSAGPTAQGSRVLDVLMNTSWGPLQDARVRQAINQAINRQRFTRLALGDIVEPLCLPWQPYQIAYQEELSDECAFNPEQAQVLLSEAEYPDGFDVVILTSTQRSADWTRFAEMLQSDLANIGIQASIEDVEASAHLQRQRDGDFQMSIHNFGRANKDPASLFGTATVWKARENSSHYYNEEYERLINEAATTMDPDERRSLYHQLNRIILDDLFILTIAELPTPWAAQEYVKDVRWTVDGIMLLEEAWLDR